jgi:hypothetical protein
LSPLGYVTPVPERPLPVSLAEAAKLKEPLRGFYIRTCLSHYCRVKAKRIAGFR